jgi:hypothetical protein
MGILMFVTGFCGWTRAYSELVMANFDYEFVLSVRERQMLYVECMYTVVYRLDL